MAATDRYYRLSVDVKSNGDVLGWSYEVRDPDETIEIFVGSLGPFDDPHDALQAAYDQVVSRWGVQPRLFLPGG